MKGVTLSMLLISSFFLSLKSQALTEKIIRKTETVKCSIDTVWWKWTSHEGLKTFLGADNKVEQKPGGAYEIYFLPDNPPGQKGGEGNTVLSYLPKIMISFTWNAPPQFPEIRNHEHKTWVVVELNAIDESSTEVSLSHLGWLEGEQWDAVYDYFDRAWGVVLSWLGESCK
ncbi:MAG: SRPBCC family protein [Bacteroidales bacterium]